MKKFLIVLVIAAVLTLSLAGCGNNTVGASPTPGLSSNVSGSPNSPMPSASASMTLSPGAVPSGGTASPSPSLSPSPSVSAMAS